MTTKVELRPDGFLVTGLAKQVSHPTLRELQAALPVQDMSWGDLTQTALFVTCNKPEAMWARLQEILENRAAHEGKAYFDWRQEVQFIPLDDHLVAVRFEVSVPRQAYDKPFHRSLRGYHVGERTVVLVRAADVSAYDWHHCQERMWRRLVSHSIVSNVSHALPLRELPAMDEVGQVVGLDESIVVVRSPATVPIDYEDAVMAMPHIAAGRNAILLMRTDPRSGQPPTQQTMPPPMRFHVDVGRTLNKLADTAFIGTDAPFITI